MHSTTCMSRSRDVERRMTSTEKIPEKSGFRRFRNFSDVPENATRADIERIMTGGKADEETDCGSNDDGTSKSPEERTKSSSTSNTHLGSPPVSLGIRRSSSFPAKLYTILADPRFNEIIRWRPHGRSWEVLDRDAFIKHVASTYFSFSKYVSFTRQVTGWRFRRVTDGPDLNSYYHELFMRGKPHLIKFMKRDKNSVPKKDDQRYEDPNFYELSKKYPLPALPEAPPPHVDEYAQQSTPYYSGSWGAHHGPPLLHGHHQMYQHPRMNIGYDQGYYQWVSPSGAPPPSYMPSPLQLQYYMYNQYGQGQGESQSQTQEQNLNEHHQDEHERLQYGPPPMYRPTNDGCNDGQQQYLHLDGHQDNHERLPCAPPPMYRPINDSCNDGQQGASPPQPPGPNFRSTNMPVSPLMITAKKSDVV